MSDERVGLFISHKVEKHREAAFVIKSILESRTDRLDVFISESDVEAGQDWRHRIEKAIEHAHILLVLFPGDDADMSWINREIKQFKSRSADRRLIVMKQPEDSLPRSLAKFQALNAAEGELIEHFLRPLYHQKSDFVKLKSPLNRNVSDFAIEADARAITNAFCDVREHAWRFQPERLVIDVSTCRSPSLDSIDDAQVEALLGCSRILNWRANAFSWKALHERAIQEKGKGTFWVDEMHIVIKAVANGSLPPVMTSTFRGRGTEVAGQIFRPHLDGVGFVDENPLRFQFSFHEVLVPEQVRGIGAMGTVFSNLHTATRFRWEILQPFLVHGVLERGVLPNAFSAEEQEQIVAQIAGSLRIIDLEEERHRIIESAAGSFESVDQGEIQSLLHARETIRERIRTALGDKNFQAVINELERALDVNSAALQLLAKRFLQLVSLDRERVQQLLKSSANAGNLPTTAAAAGVPQG